MSRLRWHILNYSSVCEVYRSRPSTRPYSPLALLCIHDTTADMIDLPTNRDGHAHTDTHTHTHTRPRVKIVFVWFQCPNESLRCHIKILWFFVLILSHTRTHTHTQARTHTHTQARTRTHTHTGTTDDRPPSWRHPAVSAVSSQFRHVRIASYPWQPSSAKETPIRVARGIRRGPRICHPAVGTLGLGGTLWNVRRFSVFHGRPFVNVSFVTERFSRRGYESLFYCRRKNGPNINLVIYKRLVELRLQDTRHKDPP